MLKQLLKDEYRFLTFRAPSAMIRERPGAYLAFGLVATWLAGIGRYWDSSNALPWQYMGLSSLVYVFLLALVIWAVILPLGPRNWSYRNVLVFIALTAPPALLYAIPVEQFMEWSIARTVNSVFLAVVALWRVALLFVFLKRVAGLAGPTIVVAALTPLVLVVDGIALMNLQHVVYANMVGMHDPDAASEDAGGAVARTTCSVAAILTPALLLAYGWIAHKLPKRRVVVRVP